MDRRIASLLLVAVAFGIGIVVADHSGAQNTPHDTLSARLASVCLIALTGVSVYLWYRHVLGQARQKWADILDLIDGEFSRWRVAVRGTDKGTPVFVSIDPEPVQDSKASPVKAPGDTAKYLYALTMAFPVSGETDWSIVPSGESQAGPRPVSWQVVTTDPELKKKFEDGEIPRLMAECDTTARLVCNAKVGQVTLEYPAPDTSYCPDPDAFQKELELLRKAVGLWNQNTHSIIAA